MAESAETKKIIDDPRVEIDTSPPFESVKEAVDRFGGSGPWIPHHLLRLAAHSNGAFDVDRIEEQAFQLERDLIMKEQQTLNVLKELESAKRFVEGLKLNLMPELSSFMDSPPSRREGTSPCPGVSPSLMFTELNQAKSNLSKTSVDLAAIQASVESLNKKLKKDKILLDRRDQIQTDNSRDHEAVPALSIQENQRDVNRVDVSLILSKQVTFEAEQFKRMTEASRYEVMKAMAEIERTKNCIRMAEMRLNAAKKMEEAAKAVEAIALAQRKFLSSNEIPSGSCIRQEPDGITLSFEEYKALSQRAKQGDHDHQLCKTKFIDTNGLQRSKDEPRHHHDHHHQDHLQVPILEKFEETTTTTTTTTNENRNRNRNRNRAVFNEDGPNHHTNVVMEDSFSTTHVEQGRVERSGNNFSMFKFRNSHAGNRSGTDDERPPVPGFRSTTSIGDVLSRKLIVEDEVHVENHGDERRHVSLSQMLREQSRLILHPNKTTAEKQQYFMQRKKFGFIQLPIPTKQSKKKNANL